MRPLSGDYAFNFSNVAPLYAGDPQSPGAWLETVARVRARARQHEADLAARDPESGRARGRLLEELSAVHALSSHPWR